MNRGGRTPADGGRLQNGRLRGVAAVTVVAMLAVACSGDGPAETGADHPSDTGAVTGTAAPPSPSPSTPAPTTSPAPTSAVPPVLPEPDDSALEQLRTEVADLSLEALVGQLIVASYGGVNSSQAAALVSRHNLGGVIVLGDNVPTDPSDRVAAMSDLTARVEESVAETRRWPAFIGIDQEGGPLTRIRVPLDRWPAAMAIGAADDPDLAREVAQASGEQLRALGFTVVFAPVADVTSGADDPTIGLRSPGSDPVAVATVATAQTRGYVDAGILPVIKHPPGHGSVPADSHVGIARQDADLETLRARDLVPFQLLAEAGAPAMMVAHVLVTEVDDERPASLSPDVTTGLLQDELGFEGLIVTDALNMAAVSDFYGSGQAAVLALEAGADVLLMPTDPAEAIDAVVQAVRDGQLDRADLEDSAVQMISSLRSVLTDRPSPAVIGSQGELAQRAAAAGITQLDGACGQPLVEGGIQIVGGSPEDQEALAQAAGAAGLTVGSGTSVRLLGATPEPGSSADIVVALDVPYPLADSTAEVAHIAAFGRDSATMQAVVAVLTGESPAPGRLPVPVGDWTIGTGCS